ncbi:unnamed protein product [Clavelina lepadiformis]|uniref:Uncharacterized protein n=1 Tax=Clavelina lepadiformis TaxID=159417 RepID=A0ABP0G7V5_CLALP
MPLLVDFFKSPIRSCLTSYHETVSQNIQSQCFHNFGGKETALPTPAATRSLRISGDKKTALELLRQRGGIGTTGGIETVRQLRREKKQLWNSGVKEVAPELQQQQDCSECFVQELNSVGSGGEDPSPGSSSKKKLKQAAPEFSSIYNKTVPKHNSSGNETGPEFNFCGKILRMSISSSNVLGQMLEPALHLLVQKLSCRIAIERGGMNSDIEEQASGTRLCSCCVLH